MAMSPGLPVGIKLCQRCLFYRSVFGDCDEILIRLGIHSRRNHCSNPLVLHQIQEVDRRSSLGGSA